MRQLKITPRPRPEGLAGLGRYLHEVGRLPLLAPEEEVRLAHRIRSGDRSAVDQLVKANLRFVVSVARQYTGLGLAVEDLVAEGNIGLVKAAHRFDPTKGFRFISYAVWWIRQALLQALADKGGLVRLPVKRAQERRRLLEALSRAEQQKGRPVLPEEVAQQHGGRAMDVVHLLGERTPLRIDAPSPQGDRPPADVLADPATGPEEQADGQVVAALVRGQLAHLPLRHVEVLARHFGLGGRPAQDLTAIAADLGVSKERVRQIKERGLAQLRTRLGPAQHELEQR